MYSAADVDDFIDRFSYYLTMYQTLKLSKNEFYKLRDDPDVAELLRSRQSQINNAEKLRHLKTGGNSRNLEVLYINGSSGSGKTLLAKYLAELKHFDAFVSGSGADTLDGYDLEECIILDDFRGGTMKFSELLKFLDNHTDSSVASRYVNKDISHCSLIIITSVIQPSELYNVLQQEETKEEAKQLYRRLRNHMIRVGQNGDIMDYNIADDGKVSTRGKFNFTIQDVKKYYGIEDSTQGSMFDELLITEAT